MSITSMSNLSNVAIGSTVSVASNDLTPTIATVVIVLIKEFFSWLRTKKERRKGVTVEQRLEKLENNNKK